MPRFNQRKAIGGQLARTRDSHLVRRLQPNIYGANRTSEQMNMDKKKSPVDMDVLKVKTVEENDIIINAVIANEGIKRTGALHVTKSFIYAHQPIADTAQTQKELKDKFGDMLVESQGMGAFAKGGDDEDKKEDAFMPDQKLLEDMAASAFRVAVKAGQVIVSGDAHYNEHFYIVHKGTFDEVTNQAETRVRTSVGAGFLRELKEGDSFGETALFYHCPSPVDITAKTDGELFVINQGVFKKMIKKVAQKQLEEFAAILDHTSFAKKLKKEQKEALADALVKVNYKQGKVITTEANNKVFEELHLLVHGSAERQEVEKPKSNKKDGEAPAPQETPKNDDGLNSHSIEVGERLVGTAENPKILGEKSFLMGELSTTGNLSKYVAKTDCVCFVLKKKVLAMLLAHKTDDNPFVLQEFLAGNMEDVGEFNNEKNVVEFLFSENAEGDSGAPKLKGGSGLKHSDHEKVGTHSKKYLNSSKNDFYISKK